MHDRFVTSSATAAFVGVLVAASFSASLPAAREQGEQPAAQGQSTGRQDAAAHLYIAAVRDSGLFTPCPPSNCCNAALH